METVILKKIMIEKKTNLLKTTRFFLSTLENFNEIGDKKTEPTHKC